MIVYAGHNEKLADEYGPPGWGERTRTWLETRLSPHSLLLANLLVPILSTVIDGYGVLANGLAERIAAAFGRPEESKPGLALLAPYAMPETLAGARRACGTQRARREAAGGTLSGPP